VERCKKYISYHGRYFEKDTVTAPPQKIPTRSNKVSPRTFQTTLVLDVVVPCVSTSIHIDYFTPLGNKNYS